MNNCPKCGRQMDNAVNQLWHDTYCGCLDHLDHLFKTATIERGTHNCSSCGVRLTGTTHNQALCIKLNATERVIEAPVVKKFLVYAEKCSEILYVTSTSDNNYYIGLENGDRLLRSQEEIEKLGL